MDKQYKNLIEQQNISLEATARFYEALEKNEIRHKSVRWKVVLAAACLALLIPLTVLAVENMFGVPKVKLGRLDWHDSPNGYSIQFDNMQSFSMKTFPREMRTLAESKWVPCESWEDAEKTLGIGLLKNTALENGSKVKLSYDSLGNAHCHIWYAQYEGQLYYVSTNAHYKYQNVQIDLKAKVTVEHPNLDEKSKQLLLGIEGVYTNPANVKPTYEEYTTKEGIPAVILRFDLGQTVRYVAVFAVNNVSYEVTTFFTPDKEASQKRILKDVLDGFKLQ